jgi:uncharacterized protein (DUF58 family)
MSKLFTFAVALLLIALILRSEIMSAVAVALAAAAWLNTIWLRRVERGLRVRRDVTHSLAFGEDALSSVVIDNSSLMRVPWLEIRESVPLGLRSALPQPTVITLGAGQAHSFQYPIRGLRRGWYTLGPTRMVLGDVLGIQKRRLNIPAAHIIVYPRVMPLPVLGLPATLVYGPLQPLGVRQRIEDPARPSGVRQYVPGDDMRRLDWKSSARQNTLLVRRADPSIAPETMIAVAFSKTDYPLEALHDALERAAICAASLATALLQRKLPVALLTNGFDPQTKLAGIRLGFGKGEGQRREILAALGRINNSDELSLFGMLQAQSLPWGGTLVLVMSNLSLETLSSVLTLRRRGQQIVLVLVEGTSEGLVLARQQHLLAYTVDRGGTPVPEWS